MAKYEREFAGDLHEFLRYLDTRVITGSMSASVEDSADLQAGDATVAVRVYERYSMLGGNRVSLNVTVLAHRGRLAVAAITSGGSQAMFYKINRWGEENFLVGLRQAIDEYADRGASSS